MSHILRVGTRTSPLAMAQTQLVINQLQKKHSTLNIEIVGIKVRTDEGVQTDYNSKPLWELDGTNFFTKELDEALLDKKIDFAVHSLKDLSTARPKGITLAAIPPRADPHDIVFFRPDIMEQLQQGTPLILGTSAPRRILNVSRFLERALPQLHSSPIEITSVPIRGNVGTRLNRLFDSGEKRVDAVTLALAGISRLYNNGMLHNELKNLRWMILPFSLCPAAPGQGALAIECRSDDVKTIELLEAIHDDQTAEHVARERTELMRHGGGCHQQFGATDVPHRYFLDGLTYIYGKTTEGKILDQIIWNTPAQPDKSATIWDGMAMRPKNSEERLPIDLKNTTAVFVTHARAIDDHLAKNLTASHIWTSGTESWFNLAQKGVWVEGCADGLGVDAIQETVAASCLQLPAWKDWTIITHTGATNNWSGNHVIASYTITQTHAPETADTLRKATHIFWGSSFQFDQYKKDIPADAHHACGPGRTADYLQQQKLSNLTIFPNHGEWQKWLTA